MHTQLTRRVLGGPWSDRRVPLRRASHAFGAAGRDDTRRCGLKADWECLLGNSEEDRWPGGAHPEM